MEYINIHRATLMTEPMLNAEPQDGWTWLRLQSYCVGQENGGVIKGARNWTERTWMRAAMIGKIEVDRECQLWRFEGEDLHLEFYPYEQEAAHRKKRRGGSKGATNRWHQKEAMPLAKPLGVPLGMPLAKPLGVPLGMPLAKPLGEPEAEPMGELMRKGKEGKVKESKGRGKEPPLETFLDSEIPTKDQVRDWASSTGEIDPDYAAAKWDATTEKNFWVVNGKVIDWRKCFLRFWSEDKTEWNSKRKTRGAGRAEGDLDWWWTESLDVVEKALRGALLGADPSASRLREVFESRKGQNS